MIFRWIFDLLSSSIPLTLYLFACATILCVVFQLVFLRKANHREEKPLTAKHFAGVYVLLFYLLLVYLVTGVGTVWDIGRYETLIRMSEVHLIPFGTYDGTIVGTAPYLLNIYMTIPLGFLLALIWPRLRSVKKVALIGLSFSLAIELSQLLNRRGSTVDDLLMNTLGTVLGYLLFMGLYTLFTRRRKPSSCQAKYGNSPEASPTPTKKKRYSSPLLMHEPIIYLICSFVGVFFLFSSNVAANLPSFGLGATGDVYVADNQENHEYIKGVVAEISGAQRDGPPSAQQSSRGIEA